MRKNIFILILIYVSPLIIIFIPKLQLVILSMLSDIEEILIS